MFTKKGGLSFACFYLVVEVFGFLRSKAFMDYGADSFDGCNWSFGLPDVAAQVDANCAFLNAVVNEVENFPLRISLWSTSNNNWHWATVNDFFKVFLAIVGFYYSRTDFCGDTSNQCEVACFSFFKFFAHSRNRHYGYAVIFAFVNEFGEVA